MTKTVSKPESKSPTQKKSIKKSENLQTKKQTTRVEKKSLPNGHVSAQKRGAVFTSASKGVSKKSSGEQLVYEGSTVAFSNTDDGLIWQQIQKLNASFVDKNNLKGIGDFWRENLPKEVSVYGIRPVYRIGIGLDPMEKIKIKARVKFLEDMVASFGQWSEEQDMRIKGLEKTLCHLMDALKK